MLSMRIILPVILSYCLLPAMAEAGCRMDGKVWKYLPIVNGTAQRHGVDPHLILAVIQVESDFEARAVSSVGARGMMQLMPETAEELGVANSFNPYDNVDGGTRYLREMVLRYGSVRMGLMAYNAGPGRVDSGYVPMESIRYANRVLRNFWCYRSRTMS